MDTILKIVAVIVLFAMMMVIAIWLMLKMCGA